jgi:hypothetical protein
MTARKALLVVSFDSQLKWANGLRIALEARGFECRFIVPSDLRYAISDEQLADFAGTEVEYLAWDDLLVESMSVDAIALVIQGSFVATFCHQMHDLVARTGQTSPVTIAGWVGVIIHEITAGFLDRFAADVVAVNSRSDLRTFSEVAAGLGLPTDSLVLSGLPLLSVYREPPVDAPIETVLYADQPTVPSGLKDRLFIYEQLIAYANKHPDRSVVLKPRHRLEEGTIHRMKYHPELVLSGISQPANFKIDYTPISERLADLDLMLAISSTAGLEAVGAGIRTAFIADLGVREPLGNHIFLESGLLRTFEQIEKDDVGAPARQWVDDYFFDESDVEDEVSRPAERLAARVVELLEPDAVRPSRAAWASAYFESQHRLLEYRETTQVPGVRQRNLFPSVARRLRLLAQAVLPGQASVALQAIVRRIWPRRGGFTKS